MLVDQIDFLAELPAGTRALLARLLLILAVVFFIWLLRRVLNWFVIRPLRRMVHRTGFDQDDMLLDALMPSIRLFVIAVAMAISLELFRVGDSLDTFIANVSRTLVILALLTGVFRAVDVLAMNAMRFTRITGIEIEERLLPFLRTGAKLVVMAVGLVIVLQEWGYDVSGLIAGFGLGGLAFSLAAQDTVGNLFGFMAIVSDNPFDVGEYIITPDAEGVVEHVGLRATRIRTLDQAVIYVPNSRVANSAVTNWSRLSKRRVNYTLGVTYDTTSGDMRVLLERIRELLRREPEVDADSVTVLFTEFGDSALNVMVRCYVLIADWGEFHLYQEQLHMKIMDIVADLKLSIAFPSMSLYVENLPAPSSEPDRPQAPPRLSPRERALKAGVPLPSDKPQVSDDPEENITGQQDDS